MVDKILRGAIIGLVICVIIICIINFVWAGEKEEFTLKAQLLYETVQRTKAENALANAKFVAFSIELDAKGYQIVSQGGTIIVQPKPPEKKTEPPKPEKKEK